VGGGAQGPTASLRMTGYNFTFSTNFTTLGQQGNAEYYFAGNLTASVRPRAARRRTPAACPDARAPCCKPVPAPARSARPRPREAASGGAGAAVLRRALLPCRVRCSARR